MSESISCHDADGTEDKSKVSIYHYCGNCEGDIWEWSEEVVPSKTALLTKLRDEVEGLRTWHMDAEGVWVSHKEKPGVFLSRSEVLALIADLEKGGAGK